MNDILETELQLLKDDSTKSIKTTLKNGAEIILYSPKYVKLIENENKQMSEKIANALDILDLIIPELWNISNAMTYKIKAVKRALGENNE